MIGLLIAVWLAASGPSSAGVATRSVVTCTCATAPDANGWCEAHGIGYVAMVKIRSRVLYEALDAHGHTLDLDTFTCPSCRKAIDSDGFCDEHRIGFVRKQAYFSRLTYEMARGRPRTGRISCPVCRSHSRDHGWCPRCKIGMVGKIALVDRESYEGVSRAIDVLQAANKAAQRCESCAMAMVTDTRCPICRIAYKDGKPVPPASIPPASKPR